MAVWHQIRTADYLVPSPADFATVAAFAQHVHVLVVSFHQQGHHCRAGSEATNRAAGASMYRRPLRLGM